MTPETARAMTRRMIDQHGEDVTIRRLQPAPTTDKAVKAKISKFDPNEIAGGIDQGMRKVIIMHEDLLTSPAWPWPPKMNDLILIRVGAADARTLSVRSVDSSSRRVGGTLIAYEIMASGL